MNRVSTTRVLALRQANDLSLRLADWSGFEKRWRAVDNDMDDAWYDFMQLISDIDAFAKTSRNSRLQAAARRTKALADRQKANFGSLSDEIKLLRQALQEI